MLSLLGEQVASATVTCSLQHLMEELVGRCLSIASVSELSRASRLIEATCRDTLRAERTTLWVLEAKSQVLVAEIVKEVDKNGVEQLTHIRTEVGKGFAGICCKEGGTMFVNDPYSHPLFNPDVDRRTGYVTRSIMCMPLRDTRDKIVAVLQMLNRPGGFGRLQVAVPPSQSLTSLVSHPLSTTHASDLLPPLLPPLPPVPSVSPLLESLLSVLLSSHHTHCLSCRSARSRSSRSRRPSRSMVKVQP